MAGARGDQLHVPAMPGGHNPGAANVIVTGPESSGTRFVSRWLEAHPDVAARHWSMPAGESWARHWPPDHDFDGEPPLAVVMVLRNFEATIASQVNRRMVSCHEEAEANITQTYLRILTWTLSHGFQLYPLIYDTIVEHPETMADLFRWLGVDPVDCPEDPVDANAKWREQGVPDPDEPTDLDVIEAAAEVYE